MKRIVGVTYCDGLCIGVTVDGIIDDNTQSDEHVHFERIVHAHWIGGDYDKCSVCGGMGLGRTNYCPHCGAKMDEVMNNENK